MTMIKKDGCASKGDEHSSISLRMPIHHALEMKNHPLNCEQLCI